LEEFLDQYGYLALSIGTFFEGETAILIVSALVHKGLFLFPLTVLSAFAGSFVSDWIYYLIGRVNGKVFLSTRPNLQAKMLPLTDFFERNRYQILFSYRFLYGFRIIIPIMIGMSGLSPKRFLLYSSITGLIWATAVSTVGYWAGRIFNLDAKIFQDNLLLIVIGFASLGLLIGFGVKKLTFKETSI
jgi:membrane protein DedA with SNARE-associated domain